MGQMQSPDTARFRSLVLGVAFGDVRLVMQPGRRGTEKLARRPGGYGTTSVKSTRLVVCAKNSHDPLIGGWIGPGATGGTMKAIR